jgi:nucleoside-diphosphate-sugar epimerase
MKVVITGAIGLLGRVATQFLVDSGHDVVAVDRAEGPVPQGVNLHIGDLADLDFVQKAINGAEAVVHLAAIPNPLPGQEYGVFRNNVLSSFTVFNAAAEAGCKIVAYASSLSIYGTAWSPEWTSPHYVPVDEPHPIVYSESYALSKEVAELTALDWSRRSNTAFVGFRFPYTNSADDLLNCARLLKAEDPAFSPRAAKILWAYLDSRDAAAALEITIRSDLKGSRAYNFAAPDTMATRTTESLLAQYHPTSTLRGDFSAQQSPVSSTLWLKEMGYHPRYLIDRALI